MATKLALIIGSNRGIGIEFCRQLHAAGWDVLAACRSSSDELESMGVHVVPGVDITKDGGCAPVVDALRSRKISLLVSCAGLLRVDTLDTLDCADIEQQFAVNALGPLRMVAALRAWLQHGSKVLLLSSKMASLQEAPGKMYGYRMSKAALNMAGRCLARDLAPGGVAVGLIHPGVVGTQMYETFNGDARVRPAGERPPPLSPAESVTGVLAVAERLLTLETSGRFWSYNGAELPL